MKKSSGKILLGFLLSVSAIMPSMANGTNVTLGSQVQDVISLMLERTSDGKMVSQDDLDGTLVSNEVIDFGQVNALGIDTSIPSHILSRTVTGTNLTSGTLKARVIDTTGKLYDANGAGTALPKATNDGAVYYLEGALQLRVLRSGGSATVPVNTDIKVSQATGGKLAAIASLGTQSFADGQSLPATSIIDFATPPLNTLKIGLAHNTPLPITVGVKVPFSKVPELGLTTKIIFTGI